MKADMDLMYTCDTGVEVKIETAIDGIVVHTKDGEHKNRFTISGKDAKEIGLMLAASSKHNQVQNMKAD